MGVTRSAVVQDFFYAPGGSEEVAIALADLMPGSDIVTSFMEPVVPGATRRPPDPDVAAPAHSRGHEAVSELPAAVSALVRAVGPSGL